MRHPDYECSHACPTCGVVSTHVPHCEPEQQFAEIPCSKHRTKLRLVADVSVRHETHAQLDRSA